MDNNINFKGVFWFQQPPKVIKKIVGNEGRIFNNFTNEGDVLYITNRFQDKKIAEYLTANRKIAFKYYPKLNLKSGLSLQKYEDVRKFLVDYKSKIITNADDLKNIFRLNKHVVKFSTKKRDNTLEKSLKALNMNVNDYKIKRMDGFNEIYTGDGELVALISEPGKYGFRYARVDTIDDSGKKITKRYAIRGDKIQFTYINDADENIQNGTTEFLKRYYEAINANRNITRT